MESVSYESRKFNRVLFINKQVIFQEKLLEYQLKAESLLNVLLERGISHYSYATLHHYLWTIHDNIKWAKVLNEYVLNTLRRIVALMEPPRGTSGNMH